MPATGRDFFINGMTMVSVKGPAGSTIATLTQLGLPETPIRVSPRIPMEDLNVEAWGKTPVDKQVFPGTAEISMDISHIDRGVLDVCVHLAMAAQGGTAADAAIGQLAVGGARMGANTPRFNTNNCYISLNLLAPVSLKPWRFYTTYLVENPIEHELGAKRSLFRLKWLAIPYLPDPWVGFNNIQGAGSAGLPLWDHITDNP